MLYIKVLLWTPAECMQRGTLTRKEGGRRGKVMSYDSFQKYCCFPKMSDVGIFRRGVGSHAIDLQSPSADSGVRYTVKSRDISVTSDAPATLLTLPARFRFRVERGTSQSHAAEEEASCPSLYFRVSSTYIRSSIA